MERSAQIALIPIGISVFGRMRLLEHDDRQISLPTLFSLVIPAEFVTNFFNSLDERGDVSLPSGFLKANACRLRRILRKTRVASVGLVADCSH